MSKNLEKNTAYNIGDFRIILNDNNELNILVTSNKKNSLIVMPDSSNSIMIKSIKGHEFRSLP